MKFKKLAISLVLVILLATPVFAHSGGTDGYGGHYNHSTGEYHYHHGESAHKHWDMNGDGYLDCPIDKRTTSEKAPTYSWEQKRDELLEKYSTKSTEETQEQIKVETKEPKSTQYTIIIVVCCLSAFMLLVVYVPAAIRHFRDRKQ